MRSIVRVIAACVTLVALASALAHCRPGIVIEDAFCRGGQTFIHWSDPDTEYIRYHVYRSDRQISGDTLASAELVDANVPLGSAKDRAASYVARSQYKTDPNRGLRIFDLGDPLDPQDGLWVGTVRNPGCHYYAVLGVNADGTEDTRAVSGSNSLALGVEETPGPASPILDEQGVINQGGWDYPWKTFIWYRQFDEATHDGEPTKLTVTFPSSDTTKKYPAILNLHGIGGTNGVLPWWGTIIIAPCDYTSYLPCANNSWWYGYSNAYPDITSGMVVNYTEAMLLHMLGWANTSLPVDPNRVFLNGMSMGATGAVSFGLRHPDVFAGVVATVPQVNPGLPGIGWSQDQLSQIWGSVSANRPTNEGTGVWDRMNMTAYVASHQQDMPFLKVQNSKNDTVLGWFQIPAFYRNLCTSRLGFIAAWGQGGHVNSSSGLPKEYASFDICGKIRLNQSYVAVSNASTSDNPGNGDPLNGDSIGQINAGYAWTVLTDTTQEWSANISYTGSKASACADISARRLQSFSFSAGDQLAYSLSDSGGKVLRTGTVTAERDRFFVVPQLPFDNTQRKLALWKRSGQTIGDVRSIGSGEDVDLDRVVVTAVFPDVCYAQSMDRVASIAILGASGLAEGNLIRLRGTKDTFGLMVAVSASPSAPPSYGKMPLEPFGTPRPFAAWENCSIMLGGFVKAWGVVRSSGTDWFTIAADTGTTLVFGSVGTPPVTGSFVTAVGIASETTGPNGQTHGIRVRQAADIVRP